MSAFRHVLLVDFKDEAGDDQIQLMMDALGALPALIPGIREYSFGLDLGLREGNPDFGLVADFASEEDWRSYQANADHVAAVELVNAVAATKTSMQFLVPA